MDPVAGANDILFSGDIRQMYDCVDRSQMFEALRSEELFQPCVPVYSVFYALRLAVADLLQLRRRRALDRNHQRRRCDRWRGRG